MRCLPGQESSRHGFSRNYQELKVKTSRGPATSRRLNRSLNMVQLGVTVFECSQKALFWEAKLFLNGLRSTLIQWLRV
jgi:hypothetical protein